jgi:WD40 repeat protein/energy-coupling factor transporter ATP-binding protein EcfA2
LTRERVGVVFLAGPAGIGKTRLAAAFAEELHEEGAPVLYGRCGPAPAPPLEPFAQALSGLGVPQADLAGPDHERPTASPGAALAAVLERKGAGLGLLVLDELHLADRAVLEALQRLSGSGAAGSWLVLGLYRDDVAAPMLDALVESVDPDGAWRRRLGPLGLEEVASIAAYYAGEAVPAEVAARLRRDSGGVPLLVHRSARGWARVRASRRLDAAASRGATDRGALRAVETAITEGVVELRRLREQTPEGGGDRVVVCPYKGLARFEAADAEFFYGRERLVAELVARLVGAGLLGVIGPSGSGKSSLLRAGLLPSLREGVLPGSARWRQVVMRPGEHPVRELARALEVHAEGPGMLVRAAERCARTDARLLLVVDQFEEVFTACQDQAERASFQSELLAAAAAEQGAIVVLGIRADYYGRCVEHAGLAEQLASSQVLVGPMRPDELRRAIELPARRAGLRVEAELTEAMVADVAGAPGGLPLLSTALLEGWERRSGRTLTAAAYQESGGVHGAVARLAERAWQQLDPDDQAVARRILLRLAGPGEGEAVVRRRVPLREFTASPEQREPAVLDVLAGHRLLTKGEDTVEVAHEALLREWPRLRGWLEEDVQGRALHRHLIGAAREWERSGRDPGELYRGARLTGALDWARDHHADLNELEREFLEAGRAAAEREIGDARRRAEREARTSRRLQGLLAGLAAVLVLALVAGGLALDQRGRAERQALVAESRRLGAQALVQSDLDRSLLLAAEAVRLDNSADTRSALASSLLRSPQALRVLRGDGGRFLRLALSPDGGTLAAVDTRGLTYLWDARSGRRLGRPLGTPKLFLDVAAFSPDGRLLATGGAAQNGGLLLWDVASRRVVRRLPIGSDRSDANNIEDAAFSPDGRVLAVATVSGGLSLWNPASGARLGPGLHPHRQMPSLAFAPDGATLYTSGLEGRTMIWDVARRRRRRSFALGGALALSPDGKTLALGQPDGSITLVDAATGRRGRVLAGHTAAVTRLAFSHDGATLASVSDDRSAIVWDAASGRARQTLRGHAGGVFGVGFSPDDRTLYTCSRDGSVITWDLSGTRGFDRLLTRTARKVVGAAFSPRDPNLLALVQLEGPVTLWDLNKGSQRGALFPVSGWWSAVAFSPDGRVLAAANHIDGSAVLFDVTTHTRIGQPLHPSYGRISDPSYGKDINGMAFSPDGKLLATTGNDGSIMLWDLAAHPPAGRPLRPYPGVSVNGVAFSPDGTTLAAGLDNGIAVLLRVADGRVLHTLTTTGGPIGPVAFSPDGTTLATGSFDGTVTLWDPATGTARRGWTAHAGMVLSTIFSPDGSVLATSATDRTAALWDVGSGKQLGGPFASSLPVEQPNAWPVAALDPSGRTLALTLDNTLLLWDIDPAFWSRRACSVANRALTRQEWDNFLPDRPYRPSCGTR